jgi:dTDP-4-dehydrorhamnose reductase
MMIPVSPMYSIYVVKNKRMLVLGGSGLLGLNLIYHLREEFDITSTYNSTLPNIKCKWIKFHTDDLEELLDKSNYDVVINCIGLTNVDLCEINVEESNKVNAEFPRRLAEVCNRINLKLIHISTDGFESSPGDVRDERVNPISINAYSSSKLQGESFVLSASPTNLVFRTNFFGFARQGRNSLLEWIITESITSNQVKGVTDVYFSPVSTKFLSYVIRESIWNDFKGLYNLSSDLCLSKLDFIKLSLACLNFSHVKVLPIEVGELNFVAKRPKYMCLNNDKIKGILSTPIPSVESMIFDEINDMIEKQNSF